MLGISTGIPGLNVLVLYVNLASILHWHFYSLLRDTGHDRATVAHI